MAADISQIQVQLTATDSASAVIRGVQTSVERLQASYGQLLGVLGGAGIIGGFAAMTAAAVNAMNSLRELSQVTGISIENLSQFKQIATLSGTNLETVATSMQRLARTMSSSGSETAIAAGAFKFLGISAKDSSGNLKDLGDLQLEIALKLEKYADGAGKVALLQDLMGKGAGALAPYFHELAQSGKRNADVMDAQGEAAAQLVRQFRQMSIDAEKLRTDLASGMLPALQSVVKAFVDLKGHQDGMASFGETMGSVFRGVALVAGSLWIALKDMGDSLGALGAQAAALAHFDFAAISAIGKARDEQSALAQKQLDDFQKSVLSPIAIPISSAGSPKATLNYNRTDQAAALAELKLYTSALQRLEEELGKLNNQTVYEKTLNELVSGSLRTLTLDHGAELLAVARLVDIKKTEEAVMKSVAAAIEAQIVAREKLDSAVGDFHHTIATELRDIEFETSLIGKSALEREKATALQKIQIDFNAKSAAITSDETLGLTAQGVALDNLTRLRDQNTAKIIEANTAKNTGTVLDERLIRQIEFETTLVGLSNAAREKAIALRALELSGIDKETAAYKEFVERLKNAIDIKIATEDAKREQVDMWHSIERTAHDTFVSIFNSGKNAFDRLRDTLKNGLYDLLYQMTLKKWIVNIAASFSGTGVATTAFGQSGLFGSAGSFGNLSSLTSLFGSGGSAASSAAAAGISMEGAMDLGQAFSWFSKLSGFITANPITSILAGLGVIVGLSSLFGSHGKPTASLGSLSRTFGPTGAILGQNTNPNAPDINAAAIDNVTKLYAAYSDAATALGIQRSMVNFTWGANTGAGGASPNFALGGTAYDPAGRVTRQFYQAETTMSDAAVQEAASRAVLTALQGSVLPGYLRKYFDTLAPASMTKDAIEQAIAFAESLKTIRDNLSETRAPFKVLTDSAAALEATLGTTAASFKTSFLAAIDAGITSDALANWQKLAGLIDQVNTVIATATSARQNLAEQFMSDSAKLALAQSTVNDAFKALNLSVPSSRDAFAALVQGVDVTTSAGQSLLEALIRVAPAFDLITKSAETAAQAAQQAAQAAVQAAAQTTAQATALHQALIDNALKAANAAFSVLQASVAAEKNSVTATYNMIVEATNNQIKGATSSLQQLTNLSQSLKSTLSAMDQTGGSGLSRAAAQAQVASALMMAKYVGVMPSADSLKDALSVLAKPSEGLFKTFTDYQRDFIITRNNITELAKITDVHTSIAQQTLDTLNAQLDSMKSGYDQQLAALDGVLSTAQAQLNALHGINTGVISVASAIAALASATSAVNMAKSSNVSSQMAADWNRWFTSTTAGATTPFAGGTLTRGTGDTATFMNSLGTIALSQFMDLSQLAAGSPAIAAAWKQQYPGFARGGDFGGGWAMFGEQGPELAHVGPSRIYSNSESKNIIDIRPLLDEMRSLRGEVASMRKDTRRSADLWLRVTQDGDSMRTVAG